jgi:hypothetical protein
MHTCSNQRLCLHLALGHQGCRWLGGALARCALASLGCCRCLSSIARLWQQLRHGIPAGSSTIQHVSRIQWQQVCVWQKLLNKHPAANVSNLALPYT